MVDMLFLKLSPLIFSLKKRKLKSLFGYEIFFCDSVILLHLWSFLMHSTKSSNQRSSFYVAYVDVFKHFHSHRPKNKSINAKPTHAYFIFFKVITIICMVLFNFDFRSSSYICFLNKLVLLTFNYFVGFVFFLLFSLWGLCLLYYIYFRFPHNKLALHIAHLNFYMCLN